LGKVLVIGRKREPKPAAVIIALLIEFDISFNYFVKQ